jgi:hypothetical protein
MIPKSANRFSEKIDHASTKQLRRHLALQVGDDAAPLWPPCSVKRSRLRFVGRREKIKPPPRGASRRFLLRFVSPHAFSER